MYKEIEKVIWSVGHSNRPIGYFIDMLHSSGIKILIDIRSHPSSAYCPQFNKHNLSESLSAIEVAYIHMPQLGGHVPGGFKLYMASAEFAKAISQLQEIARSGNVAYMCAEADWKNCHRSLVSAYLDAAGWQVMHLKDISQSEPHKALYKQSKLF